MKTPAGKECHYYYEDFNRGRNTQECRLLKYQQTGEQWNPNDCKRCPVPDILWANASEYLQLDATIRAGFLGIGRRVEVVASCSKHGIKIADPYVGCAQCAAERPDLAAFIEGVEE